MTDGATAQTYREPGASWRPLWITLALLAVALLVVRRTDGASLLVGTRDPDSLRQALLARLNS